MARDAELRARITAKDDASKVIDKVADAADDLERKPIEIELDADVSDVLSSLDQVTDEAKRTATAAEALGRSLGPELAAKADTSAIVAEFRQMGLTFEQIEGNADTLAAKLREMSDADVGGKLGKGLGTARGEIEDLGRSADSSKSVLANMVGNTTQDLGQLGGVAGSAGVAIGQMGEYMADALADGDKLGNVLRNFATVAGPIALLALAVGTVTSLLGEQAAKAEASTQRTKQFGDAMRGASDDGVSLADSLRENIEQLTNFDAQASSFGSDVVEQLAQIGAAVPLLGGLIGDAGQNFTDLAPIMRAAGMSVYDFAEAVEQGGLVGDEWTSTLLDALDAGKITEAQYDALSQAITTYGKNVRDAKEQQALWNVDAAEADAIMSDLAAQADPLSRMVDVWSTLFSDMRDGSIDTEAAASAVNQLAEGLGLTSEQVISLAQQHLDDTMAETAEATERAADAAAEYASVLRSGDWQTSSIEAAASAWGALGDSTFGLTNIAKDSQAAYDDLNAAIEQNGFTFDLATEAGRANADQIQNLYSSIIPGLTAAYADAGGSLEQFGANMDTLRSQVFAQLDEQTSLTTDQINAVIDQLGVFDGSKYSSQFELLGTEDANSKLALLSGVIGSLPDDVQKQVTLAVLAGDPQAALDTISASVNGEPLPPAVVPIEADTSEAESAAQGFARETERTTPVVTVDANTKAAIATMAYLKVLSVLLAPVVTVTADTSPAQQSLRNLASTVTRAPVEAWLRDFPTTAEIQQRIGVVRVPIDLYVRNSPRLDGG